MANAGRILIMPKGDWNAEAEYEMLDLVFKDGASWLAKKNVVGIEPSETNTDYWMKMCEADLTSCLKLSGGTMVGDIRLGGGKGTVHSTEFTTYIRANKDNNNYRDIRIINPGNSETKTQFIQVVDFIDGVPHEYRIFGEHNQELLKPYIEQVIAEYLAKNN